MRQLVKKNTFLRRAYYRMQAMRQSSEADECEIIARLAEGAPKTFIEFGFHPAEFNCIQLAKRTDWRGLLIDGNERLVLDARAIWPSRLSMEHRFLTLDNLGFIREKFERLGVLSIDVDGNDYWFLEALIGLKPALISVEYNSTFGLEPVTVPYDPEFDRHKKHPRGWYHGASITAVAKLCAQHGYGLAAGSDGSCNAFFTRDGRLKPEDVWKPKAMREQISGIPHKNQWAHVKHLPFVSI
ncbi:MAG: hypothetical protein JO004_00690 [Methylobacteriaceae bacterium]|nr:hypothetical protein [Methylobacteriaceae bacterium]